MDQSAVQVDVTAQHQRHLLVPLNEGGQYAELAQLTTVVRRTPRYPMLVYHLACAENLSGYTGDAIGHLRRAVEAAEKLRGDARADAALEPSARSRRSRR